MDLSLMGILTQVAAYPSLAVIIILVMPSLQPCLPAA